MSSPVVHPPLDTRKFTPASVPLSQPVLRIGQPLDEPVRTDVYGTVSEGGGGEGGEGSSLSRLAAREGWLKKMEEMHVDVEDASDDQESAVGMRETWVPREAELDGTMDPSCPLHPWMDHMVVSTYAPFTSHRTTCALPRILFPTR